MSSKVAFIFPGQGSQSVGMGKDFFDNASEAKALLQAASEKCSINFEKLLFEENTDLEKTQFTQPAILLNSMMAFKLFSQEVALTPTFALGHSLGEFSALSAVGALDVVDAVELVHHRGTFMAEACADVDAGMMVVLGLSDEVLENICQSAREEGKKVWAANYNTDGQLVIAGIRADLASLEATIKEAGAKRAMLLNMSVASHCPLLESAAQKLTTNLEATLQDTFSAPVISNVTAQAYNSKVQALSLLPKQLVEPVKYKHSVANFYQDVDMMIEFGNGAVLKGMNRKISRDIKTVNVSDMKTLEEAIKLFK